MSLKLGLGKKFPYHVLYSRFNTVGISLIKPKTTIVMLSMKLYIGNKRGRTCIAKMIRIIDDMLFVEYGKGVYNQA